MCVEKQIEEFVIEAADVYVKDFVEGHLDALRDTYKRFDKPKPFVTVKWDEADSDNISGQVSFDYSYRNSYGRTIEERALGSWKGTYKNGKFTITEEMSFPGLKLAFLDTFNF